MTSQTVFWLFAVPIAFASVDLVFGEAMFIGTHLVSKWHTIRYDTIEEINVDSKAEYTA